MVRLFIAFLLPESLKARLGDLISELKPLASGIKWVNPTNLHLTLKFIGEVPEEAVLSIGDALSSAVREKAKYEVRVKECGGFPNLRNPRVLWVGLSGINRDFKIASEIDKHLLPLGIAKEKKPFSPHLTIGRIKKPGDISRLSGYIENLNFDAGTVILNKVALVKSTLTPAGPIYENLNIEELK